MAIITVGVKGRGRAWLRSLILVAISSLIFGCSVKITYKDFTYERKGPYKAQGVDVTVTHTDGTVTSFKLESANAQADALTEAIKRIPIPRGAP